MKWTDIYRDMASLGPLDLDVFCKSHGLNFKKSRAADGRSVWQLAACPFDATHTDNDAAFFQDGSGKTGFRCFHDSCKDKHWSDVRSLYKVKRGFYRRLPTGSVRSAKEDPVDNFDFASGLIDDVDFPKQEYKLEWLVKGWLVTGQNLMIGGPAKCLKTSTLVDLAVSVATGGKFLGRFEVPQPRPVMMVSGESGFPVLQGLRNRVVASKDRAPEKGMLVWNDQLPCLTNPHHCNQFEQQIIKHKIALSVIDPTYLALFSQGGADSASNVMHMGPVLAKFGAIGERTGCCMALVHHYRKQPQGRWRPPTLEDFSLSGFAEWSRQWMLLGRPQPYVGDGRHDLYLGGGGPAAGFSEWSVQINEGNPDDPLVGGRIWQIECVKWQDRLAQQRQEQQNAELHEQAQHIIQFLAGEDLPQSTNRISNGLRMRWQLCQDVLNNLGRAGHVVQVERGVWALPEPF